MTAVDFSRDMLDEAKRNAARAGAASIEFVQADVQRLAFEEGSFDMAVSRNVLWVLPDAAAAYAGAFRALRPGGVLVAFDAVSYTHLDVYKRQSRCCSPSSMMTRGHSG